MLTVYITQDYAPSGAACPRRYELVIQGMPAGRHRLRLIQRQNDLDWGLETIFFEGVVRVR